MALATNIVELLFEGLHPLMVLALAVPLTIISSVGVDHLRVTPVPENVEATFIVLTADGVFGRADGGSSIIPGVGECCRDKCRQCGSNKQEMHRLST